MYARHANDTEPIKTESVFLVYTHDMFQCYNQTKDYVVSFQEISPFKNFNVEHYTT